jgi:Uma2 family endonuclease
MLPVTEKKKYTYEDYLKTPENERYELIGGVLYMTPPPVTKHQRLSRKIEFILEKFVTENDLGEVFYAPYESILMLGMLFSLISFLSLKKDSIL